MRISSTSSVAKNNFQKAELLLQTLAWIWLLILSHTYYLERSCYSDAAFCGLQVFNTGNFFLPQSRFYDIFLQWLLLIGVKLQLSVDLCLRLYSLGPILFMALLSYLTIYLSKRSYVGWTFLLAICLGVYSSFYYLVAAPIAQCLILFFYFTLKYRLVGAKNGLKYGVTAVFCILAAGFHPFVLPEFGFFLFLIFLEKRNWKWMLFALCFTILAYFAFHAFFPSTEYETAKLREFKQALKDKPILPLSFQWYVIKAHFLNSWHIWFVLLFIPLALVLKRQWILLCSLSAIIVIYLITAALYNYHPSFPEYAELYLLPVAAILSVIFSEYLIKSSKASVLIIVVLIASILHFQSAHEVFSHRIALLDNWRQAAKENKWGDKLALRPWHVSKEDYHMDWALYAESMLLGAAHNEAFTLTTASKSENNWDKEGFVSVIFEDPERQQIAFAHPQMQLQSSRYHFVNSDVGQVTDSIPFLIEKFQFSLRHPTSSGKWHQPYLHIINKSEYIIHSGASRSTQTYLLLYNAEQELILTQPLWADVEKSWKQPLNAALLNKTKYLVHLDLWSAEKGRWNLNKSLVVDPLQ